MKIIEFLNGNIHLKIENEEKKYNKDEMFQELIEALDMNDIYISCETPYNISNYCAAIDFYCLHNDSCYTINEFEFSKLLKGETIILEGWDPSQEEKKEIEKFLKD